MKLCEVYYYLYMQKKQTRVDNASPKPDAEPAKSPSSQKAEKKAKPVLPSLCYNREICCTEICSFDLLDMCNLRENIAPISF